jgi:ClpP class serine protease
MMHHIRLAQRVFNTPLMVDPAKALAFLAGLGPRIVGREVTVNGLTVDSVYQAAAAMPARASLFGDDLAIQQARNGSQPYAVVDGIAVIGIAGTLVHRGAWIGQSSGLTSYEGIAVQLQAALADPAIRGIALDIDSFGGELNGVFDLADRIRAARQVKPVQAFVADHALSAAYALASQADRIVLSRTGTVGSIGVVVMHTDMSRSLDQDGITVTLIHAGARKIDANPYQPLPEAVRDRIAGELEELRRLFAEIVAEGRGRRLDARSALDTEAAVFRGEAAVLAGLADEVADPVVAFRAFVAASRGTATRTSNPNGKGPMMTIATEDHAQPALAPDATTQSEPAAPAASALPEPEATPSVEAIRAEAAEVAQVCAQAARLGIRIDAADAVARGVKPDVLRARILADLAARSDAAGIIAMAPAPGPRESPIVAAARKSAVAASR